MGSFQIVERYKCVHERYLPIINVLQDQAGRCRQLGWWLNVWECIVFGATGRWSLCANWRSQWPDSHRGPSLQPTGPQDYKPTRLESYRPTLQPTSIQATGPQDPPPDAQRLTLPVIHDGRLVSCHFQLGTIFRMPHPFVLNTHIRLLHTRMIYVIRRHQVVSDFIIHINSWCHLLTLGKQTCLTSKNDFDKRY